MTPYARSLFLQALKPLSVLKLTTALVLSFAFPIAALAFGWGA